MVQIHVRGRRVAPAFCMARAVALGLAVVSTNLAAQVGGQGPQSPYEVVWALYVVTDGGQTRCRHAPAEVASAHQRAVSGLSRRHPRLLSLVRASPHYETARDHFARTTAYDPVRDTPETLVPECEVAAGVLKLMTDGRAGLAEVRRYEATLMRR
ncbi:hypothetical protein [Piscinibacter gummiphilus]|uniref:Uncharacterized protein n=1 Tax=Piscinibacter gummiphilus TaxID=946333 RepID=A0A1W6L8P7_9BURK|nr:hypothetical protein [Piscinibacter gummiphilus]ARN20584.1 hypothetical protein A4W93_12140 [Piscinibacter gummiphilus]ATU65260.1 hypothetical protein CPZ87_12215 [Piscinibacter gummiphilus]GLS98334.1 hypothetical protein GCM10007918_56260 [Piscinibacter gummiphilus]